MDLENSLIALGRALSETEWQSDTETVELFSKDDGENDTSYKVKAILFLKTIEASLRKALCTPEGKVRSVVKVTPDLLAVCATVIAEETSINLDAQLLVDVVVQSNLELFCATSSR